MFYIRTFIITLLTLCLHTSFAQDTLRGRVIDGDRQPIMAAHLYWSAYPQRGAYTDPQGRFQLVLPATPDRPDSLRVTAMGFGESQLLINRAVDTTIVLRPSEYVLSAVLIQAQDPISDAFLLTKQEKLDIYLNPTAAADPLRALISLPASTNTSESANPELRGSSADRSRVLINGIPIYRPVRNTQINGIGNFSLFNTEMLESQYVYPSNPPLTRGNSTAGAVAIETVQEVTDNATQLSLGLAHAGLLRNQQLGEEAFLQAYANRQFGDLFIGLNQSSVQDLRAFRSQDAGLNLHLEPADGWSIDAFAYGIDEAYDVNIRIFGEEGPVTSNRQRHFNTLRVRKRYAKGTVSLHHGFDISRTNFAFGNTDSDQRQRTWYTALDWRRRINDSWEWQTGLVYEHQRSVFRDTVPVLFYRNAPNDPTRSEQDTLQVRRFESYRYVRFEPHDDWLFQAGLRASLNQGPGGRYFSGQLSSRWQVDPNQALLLSTGWYHSYSIPGTFDKSIRLLNSFQLALDYDLTTSNDQHAHLAAYAKRESGLFDPDQQLLEDYRWIYGLEALYEQPIAGAWSGSLAATWLHQRVYGFGSSWSGSQDQLFFVKALIQYKKPDLFDLSLNYLAHNGLWATRLEAPDEPGQAPIFPFPPNAERLQPYGSLNVSVSRYFPWGDQSLVVFVNVNNLLNQGNEQGFRYGSNYEVTGREFFQRRSIYGGLVLKL